MVAYLFDYTFINFQMPQGIKTGSLKRLRLESDCRLPVTTVIGYVKMNKLREIVNYIRIVIVNK